MDLKKTKTADLRKIAKKQKIEGWEDMEKKDLLKALEPKVKAKDSEKPKKDKAPEVPAGIDQHEEEPEEELTPETDGVKGGRTPMGSKARIMKAKLARQEKVTILIPLGKSEKPGTTTPVTLNGYRLNIQHGVYVEVPKQVAEIIMESQKQTIAALRGETVNPQSGKKKDSVLDGNEKELQ